ncbi:MAG: NAD(P)-dependent oxidoreductase [Candidatus Riflebacteria bacterium]|nr:NAD(P)-dependent oxidoreductase [Candidatus Riflebacteria bacterium]
MKESKILVTGSAGHLGEALVQTLSEANHEVVGIDIKDSRLTNEVGSIVNRSLVKHCMKGVDCVIHTATLHKPHIATHTRQDFIDTNISGTLVLLEEAASEGVSSFIFTSTTSVFGRALTPPPEEPAVWITEDITPIPKNIYGVTKRSAEDFCELFHRNHGLACLILRTSRFFPEQDDNKTVRQMYEDDNIKANEYLYRRVDLEDVVNSHLLALKQAPTIRFGKYIISATSPFSPTDLKELRTNAPNVVRRLFPAYENAFAKLGWKMFSSIDRVYCNDKARKELGWKPLYDFNYVLDRLIAGENPRSYIARSIGSKGYHSSVFVDGPYPVE